MNIKDPFINDYVKWLKKNGDEQSVKKEHEPHIIRLVFGLCCLLWKYTAILGIIVIVTYFIKRNRAKEHVKKYWKRIYGMKSIMCTPIMINSEFVEGKKDIAPGLFIGSFEDKWSKDLELRTSIYKKIMGARNGEAGQKLQEIIQKVYDNEEYVADRRRMVPLELSSGIKVYFFDVALVKDWMNPLAWTEGEWEIICAAEMGVSGEIHLIPDEAINTKLERVMKKRLGAGFEETNN